MKAFTALVFGLLALAASTQAGSTGRMDGDDNKLVNMDLKNKQILILKLLNHITEPCMYKDIEDMGKNFVIEENTDLYVKTDVVKHFVNMFKMGMLPRGEVFTIHIDRQLKEVVSMFHMLYYAKDFATFIRTACWMRLYCNEGMFVYALTVACRHREDCNGIMLPPPYEIYPYYFVRADVIQKAYLLKMRKGLLDNKLCEFYGIRKTEKDVYIIDENVYDHRHALNNDDKLRYFTEDIGLNTYFYYFHVDYPFWMKNDMMKNSLKNRRFEATMYIYQQILARYNLERLSNKMNEVNTLSWNKNVQTGYWPWMMLHNGVQLPMRMNNMRIVGDNDVNAMRLVEDYEMIIKDCIIKGFVEINGRRLELTKIEDIETLGMIIFGKVDNATNMDKTRMDAYRYLIIIMKAVLGLNTLKCDKYFVMPSTLDSYQTCLRDPVFYMLQKRIVDMCILFKMRLPCYTREELYFPGVKIDNVVVDKLMTYFDDYLMDMTNAVTLSRDEIQKTTADMKFMVRKRRLNHQPFKITVDISSDKTVDCVVRMFMGPKCDNMGCNIDINRNRMNFVEMDTFMYKLTAGRNTIVRDSKDMHNIVQDRMMTRDLWKKIETVNDMKDIVHKNLRNWHTGFPARLLLPKGQIGGMKMMLYVIVTPLKLVDNMENNINLLDANCKHCDFRSTLLLDKMPLGFPFDRHIDEINFNTPNMRFCDVTVYHKRSVCDMKTRWERYVLRDYNMMDKTNMMNENSQTYFTDVEINKDMHNTNTFDL